MQAFVKGIKCKGGMPLLELKSTTSYMNGKFWVFLWLSRNRVGTAEFDTV